MPARKLRDVLEAIRRIHRLVATRYHELRNDATDERMQLLLEDMERRERKLEECIAQYEKDAGGALLEHVDTLPILESVLRADDLAQRLERPTSLCELVEETLRLNNSLSEAYLAMARQAPADALRHLFAELAIIEDCNDRHYAKAILDVS